MTTTKKTKFSRSRRRPLPDDTWKFTLTIDSEGKRVSVRGVFRSDPDSENGDYISTVKDMDGTVLYEMPCWDQDEAVADAASHVFEKWVGR